jgi:hypothetical protein
MREAGAGDSLGRVRRTDTGQIAWVLVDHECVLRGWDGWYLPMRDVMAEPTAARRARTVECVRRNPCLRIWDSNLGPSDSLTLEGYWEV